MSADTAMDLTALLDALQARVAEGDVRTVITQQLAVRAQLVAAVAQIDAALDTAYCTLAADRPVAVPEPVTYDLRPKVTAIAAPTDPCALDVLAAVTRGCATPRELRAALPWSGQRIARVLMALVRDGRLHRDGETTNVRYTVAPTDSQAAA